MKQSPRNGADDRSQVLSPRCLDYATNPRVKKFPGARNCSLTAFSPASRADSRTAFFAKRKLASMNAFDQPSLPRGCISSESACNSRCSVPSLSHILKAPMAGLMGWKAVGHRRNGTCSCFKCERRRRSLDLQSVPTSRYFCHAALMGSNTTSV